MRAPRLAILAFGMLGGLAGPNATASAAPLPVPSAAAQATDSALLNTAHWYGRRHDRRLYCRPRNHYRHASWRPRPYYRRAYWRTHYDHRPRFYHPWH